MSDNKTEDEEAAMTTIQIAQAAVVDSLLNTWERQLETRGRKVLAQLSQEQIDELREVAVQMARNAASYLVFQDVEE